MRKNKTSNEASLHTKKKTFTDNYDIENYWTNYKKINLEIPHGLYLMELTVMILLWLATSAGKCK
jgi:hypothetical protein